MRVPFHFIPFHSLPTAELDHVVLNAPSLPVQTHRLCLYVPPKSSEGRKFGIVVNHVQRAW